MLKRIVFEIKDAFPWLFIGAYYFLGRALAECGLVAHEAAEAVAEFAKAIRPANGDFPGNIANIHNVSRKLWMEEPCIESWRYRKRETWSVFTERPLLLGKYIETDDSLRDRIMNKRGYAS